MNKNELITTLLDASKNGSLLTPKHDPNNLSTTYPNYRTVLSHELADNLDGFISSGGFEAKEYQNNAYPDSPIYIVITPSHESGFSVTASGVAPNSPFTSYAVDKLVVVSGTNQGWHVFGEDGRVIGNKIHSDEISYLGDIS